ncbi:MAG: P-II family nitrogen regulator [Nitratireductor sp.]|nr:P-II family nitrogen regulator [Nitratireductor sp.]
MKMIVAIVQPHRLENVREALNELGVAGLTVTEVKGYGRQKGHTEIYRGAEYQIHYTPKVKLEIATDNATAEKAIDAIRAAAGQNRIGDGKIFVFDLENAIRIRTGEIGEDAL